MTDNHTLTGLPHSVRDLSLNLTDLAHHVVLAAAVRNVPEAVALSESIVGAWEILTGLESDAALEAAQAISRHPLPVTAAVVPF